MNLSSIVKNIFLKLGLETYRLRPWMELSSLVQFYKIKTVIDVGANVGQFALEVNKVNTNIEIHSFEPINRVYETLLENTKKYSNIQCHQFGLGDVVGTAEINVNETSPSSSLLELGELHKKNFSFALETTKEVIQLTTLDTFFKEQKLNHPVLLKIDVQGFEENVLKGAEKTLKQVDILHIEASFCEMYKGQMLFGDLFNLILKQGFEFVGTVEHKYSVETHYLLFCNAIFKRKLIKS